MTEGDGIWPQVADFADAAIASYSFLSMAGCRCRCSRLLDQLKSSHSITLAHFGLLRFVAPAMFHLEYQKSDENAEGVDNLYLLESYTAVRADEEAHMIISISDQVGPKLQRDCSSASAKRFRPLTRKPSKKAQLLLARLISSRQSMFRERLAEVAARLGNEVSWSGLLEMANSCLPTPPISTPTIPVVLSSISSFQQEVASMPWFDNQLFHHEHLPSRAASYKELPDVSPVLEQALEELYSISSKRLYSHQVDAIEAVRSGRHTVISTSTSSGKSLVYFIAIAAALQADCRSTFLLIFPTKALAQDQAIKLRHFLAACGLGNIPVDVFDGDVLSAERKVIRNRARILITNPDTVHAAIMPYHFLWKEFLEKLRLIVVDELHSYTDTFGYKVRLVFCRLRRLLNYYQNPKSLFIGCSATITKPLEQMAFITSVDRSLIRVVAVDGSPCGARDFYFWKVSDGLIREAGLLLSFVASSRHRTIQFCRYRKTCEGVMKQAILCDSRNGDTMSVYRGGYTASVRRDIEARLFSGNLYGVIATNALELGLDIGSLDISLHVGFPSSVDSLWQQVGRTGRRDSPSISVLILNANDPVDQLYISAPSVVFEKRVLSVDFDVVYQDALIEQLQCAAHELPLDLSVDGSIFGSNIETACFAHLIPSKQGLYYANPIFGGDSPALKFSIRQSDEEDSIYLFFDGQLLEELEFSRAYGELYSGAVYMHLGCSYIVINVDLSHSRRCNLKKSNVDYVTKSEIEVTPFPLTCISTFKDQVHFGTISVSLALKRYVKFSLSKKRVVDKLEIHDHPIIEVKSFGLWFNLPREYLAGNEEEDLRQSIFDLIRVKLRNPTLEMFFKLPSVIVFCRSPRAVDQLRKLAMQLPLALKDIYTPFLTIT